MDFKSELALSMYPSEFMLDNLPWKIILSEINPVQILMCFL